MIVIKQNFTPEQLNIIKSLAENCGIMTDTAKILYSRGIDTVNKINRFLSPGKRHFTDPFKLKGVKETVERLTLARDRGETVVIFGDYDADGLCAASIMYYALREFGMNAVPVVPERSEGYGLTEKGIDKVMEQYGPDLIVTVDCGISCRQEVEYIKDLGADVIVTDHHELPELLPDCVIVNCKLKDQDFGFEYLCGAGVAYKIAAALIGSKADKLLDFAALATVADSMPLTGENRDIVYEGLKLISSRPRPVFAALLEAARCKDFNSTAVAFNLAPRINAAGRMGDAALALRLFLSADPSEIAKLAEKLNEYNTERQAECDALLASAREKLAEKGAFKRIIILEDENWKNGLVGIAAAKLVEEYCRPVIMLVKSGNMLHGSARTVEGINVLEAISHNKQYLVEYGGHSQAAGVSLRAENLEAFENGMHEYLSQRYGDDMFLPKCEAECYIEGKFPIEFAREIERLEPFGTGNRRPMFACDCSLASISKLKPDSPHIRIDTENVKLIYFGGTRYEEALRTPAKKTFVFEPNLSVYNGVESFRGYVRSFETEVSGSKELGLELYRRALRTLRRQQGEASAQYIDEKRINEVIEESLSCPYGTLFVASSYSTLARFPRLKNLPVAVGAPQHKNLGNAVVLSLTGGGAGYRKIVFLDNPLIPVRSTKRAEVFVNGDLKVADMLPEITATREGVGEVFKAIKNLGEVAASSSCELYAKIEKAAQISRYQFVFGAEVLEELGIISYVNGTFFYDPRVRSELTGSKIYRKFFKG